MYTKLFLKLSTFYVIMTIAQADSMDLCAIKHENLNTDLQYPHEKSVTSNHLLLRDCPFYPFFDNAVDHIRSFIVDKLDLPHLEWCILQATYTDKGLLFEMFSQVNVKQILDQFSIKLRHKECILKPTIKEFITLEVH